MKPKPTDKPRHAGAITEADRNELNTRARQALAAAKQRDLWKVPVPIPGVKQHTTLMVARGKSKKKAIENFLRKTKQLKQ